MLLSVLGSTSEEITTSVEVTDAVVESPESDFAGDTEGMVSI